MQDDIILTLIDMPYIGNEFPLISEVKRQPTIRSKYKHVVYWIIVARKLVHVHRATHCLGRQTNWTQCIHLLERLRRDITLTISLVGNS